MEAISALDAQGLIVTTANGCGPYDFASRYFAPRLGIPEDPVTGSAHCQLAPYWAAILGKTQFRAFQASARTGVLHVKIEGDRVLIGGQAVTVLRGEIDLGESYALDHAA
jgi:predicted PhzF superfamily epimerase YddE/YHI9